MSAPEPPEDALPVSDGSRRGRVLVSTTAPEVVVSRSIGPLARADAARHAAQISCATTFAARRAAVAELDRPSPSLPTPRGPLGGPMPARVRSEAHAAVDVVVVPGEVDGRARSKPT